MDAQSTVIQCDGSGRVITVLGDDTVSFTLDRMRLTGGDATTEVVGPGLGGGH